MTRSLHRQGICAPPAPGIKVIGKTVIELLFCGGPQEKQVRWTVTELNQE